MSTINKISRKRDKEYLQQIFYHRVWEICLFTNYCDNSYKIMCRISLPQNTQAKRVQNENRMW